MKLEYEFVEELYRHWPNTLRSKLLFDIYWHCRLNGGLERNMLPEGIA
jgi:hypothetical protein